MNIAACFGQLLFGWLIADFIGGVVHWWEDRVGHEDMPLIGRWMIAPNRLHHRDPLAFTEGDLLDRSLATTVTALALGALWYGLLGMSLTLAAAVLGGIVSCEVHHLAHRPPRDGLLRMMQEIGVIQSPRHHAAHHRPPSDRRYCVLTDWLNPVLDRIGLWDRLEALLTRLGVEPSRGAR